MKGLKNRLLSSDKDNLSEKAFKQSIAVSILGIVFCMIALCSVTWAWFFADVSSSANNIQSAHCNVTVTVKNGEKDITDNDGEYSLKKDKDYIITYGMFSYVRLQCWSINPPNDVSM